jgi:ribosomal-protein-alanine N-acetyltransferase
VRIRDALDGDVATVAAIEHETFGVDAWSPESVREELTGARRKAVLAVDGQGTVVGYAMTMRTDEVLDLQRIAVLPYHRRSGVARALLSALRRAGREAGAHRMLLEVRADNDGAVAFYAAEGFVQIDRRRRYYRDGSDALVLSAALGGAASGGKAVGTG